MSETSTTPESQAVIPDGAQGQQRPRPAGFDADVESDRATEGRLPDPVSLPMMQYFQHAGAGR